MQLADQAIQLLEQGFWPVVLRPIHWDSENDPQRGKKPMLSGWGQERPTDTFCIDNWGGLNCDRGIGLRLGPEGGLIDIDMDEPDIGVRSLQELFPDGLPYTRSWATRRGRHWLFRWDDRLEDLGKFSSNWKLVFPGLELRIGGRRKSVAATIPPTKQADGTLRKWDDPDAPFADLPYSSLQLILERCKIPKPKVYAPINLSQDWSVREKRALAWLAQRDPAISGAGGRTKFWTTIGDLAGFCVNMSELLSLASIYNQVCQPPFTDQELEQTCQRVLAHGHYSFGSKINDPPREWSRPTRSRSLSPAPAPAFSNSESQFVPFPDWEATDIGNARRFAAECNGAARYCLQSGQWLIWDGMRFLPDSKDRITSMGMDAIRSWVAQAQGNSDRTFVKWYIESQSRARIEAMLRLARAIPGVSVDLDDFDQDPWVINTLSGIVDLRTGEVRPHDPAALCSRLAPVEFDPSAQSQAWESFLSQVTCDNQEVIKYLQRVGGYALTGNTSEQQFWTFWGGGRNGKGVLVECWLAALGDYACTVAPDLFLVKDKPMHPTSLMELQGRRLVFTDEIEEGKKLDEGQMKRLTGGLPIKARRMKKDEVEFLPSCKIFLLTNDRPEIHGTDSAIWARLRLVNFPVKFVGPDDPEPVSPPLFLPKILGLAEKLKTEDRNAIFAWMVAGCRHWLADGLGVPTEVKSATNEYREEQNRVKTFVTESCDVGPFFEVTGAEIYKSYRSWCSENGYKALGNAKFTAQLERLGYTRSRSKNARKWSGLAISTTF